MNEINLHEELLDKRFYLERFYIRRWGILGKLFPFWFTIVFAIIGYFAGIFSPPIQFFASVSYIYWILFIPFTVYLMTWLDREIKRTIRRVNEVITYERETQKNLLNSLYGLPGILMSVLFALPFVIYDITGFFVTSEGWLKDIAFLDNTWYPGIDITTNGIGFGSLLWLVIWIIPWFFMGALIWMAIAFIIYIRSKLKETKWKDDILKVAREKQHKKILTRAILTFLPLSPFIAIKFIYQAFFDIWWSDTISLYLLLILFLVGTIIAPTIIAKDIDHEKAEALQKIEKVQNEQFDATAKCLVDGVECSTDSMLRAVLIHLYTEKVHIELQKKTLDKHLVNKMIVAALVPLITIAIRYLAGPLLALFGIAL
jgi:hypothetical protein